MSHCTPLETTRASVSPLHRARFTSRECHFKCSHELTTSLDPVLLGFQLRAALPTHPSGHTVLWGILITALIGTRTNPWQHQTITVIFPSCAAHQGCDHKAPQGTVFLHMLYRNNTIAQGNQSTDCCFLGKTNNCQTAKNFQGLIFQILDGTWSNLGYWKVCLPMAGGGMGWVLRSFPSQTILRFRDLLHSSSCTGFSEQF